MPISVKKAGLESVLVIEPTRHSDARGWFEESWSKHDFASAGIQTQFVQDNHSASDKAGTLRGMHCQAPPNAQSKLVRCTRGAIYDVIVDFRRGSPSHGRWEAFELSAENGRQLLVPAGFLHGFLSLMDNTHVQYRSSDYYAPESEITIRWDSLGIEWPSVGTPILSSRDSSAPAFDEIESPFRWSNEA